MSEPTSDENSKASESRFQFSPAELTDECGGLGRIPFLILFPGIAFLGVAAGRIGEVDDEIALWVTFVVLLLLAGARLRNLGYSTWRLLIPLVPALIILLYPELPSPARSSPIKVVVWAIVSIAVFFIVLIRCLLFYLRLFAGPVGYGDNRKLDKPGLVIALVMVGMALLGGFIVYSQIQEMRDRSSQKQNVLLTREPQQLLAGSVTTKHATGSAHPTSATLPTGYRSNGTFVALEDAGFEFDGAFGFAFELALQFESQHLTAFEIVIDNDLALAI